jgi:hypothetical protein
MMFNYFQGWIDARAVDMSESSNELLEVVATQLKTEELRNRGGAPRQEPLPRVGLAGRVG